MSRGGRGGGRAAATAGIRAVANALGIARNEMNAFTKIITEAPPLFPAMAHMPAHAKMSDEEQYQVELKQELLTRFHESSFYMEDEKKSSDIRRYTDKYRNIEKESIKPNWKRLPKELRPLKRLVKVDESGSKKKRRKNKNNKNSDAVDEKLAALEQKEVNNKETIDERNNDDDDENESGSETEEVNENDEQEVPSDDDYLEEDNDYVHSYFDNGENYGDAGSDDNLDEDNAY